MKVKILSAIAVFAAAGMVLAGCDSLNGTGSGGEAAFAELDALAFNSAGTVADSGVPVKKIKVKFDVRNGGYGLIGSLGIVSNQADENFVCDEGICAGDFTVTVKVPESDVYLNIYWYCEDLFMRDTYLMAKTKTETGTITLDYNGVGKIAAKNLYDVRVGGVQSEPYQNWWRAKLKTVRHYG